MVIGTFFFYQNPVLLFSETAVCSRGYRSIGHAYPKHRASGANAHFYCSRSEWHGLEWSVDVAPWR